VSELKTKDKTVHFIKEGFNTVNGNGMFKFLLTTLGAVAEMERELTVVRIREGIAKAKCCGARPGHRGMKEILWLQPMPDYQINRGKQADAV
jgi:DNA invertase Pin-like site-specific DNA recombinase